MSLTRHAALCFLISIGLLGALRTPASAAPGAAGIQGVTSVAGAGVQEPVRQIMQRQAAKDALGPREPHQTEKEVVQPDRTHLKPNPESPPVSEINQLINDPNAPRSASPQGVRMVMSPQSVSSTPAPFTGTTLATTLSFPPDAMGVVGPSQYFMFVNGRLETFSKFSGKADGAVNADPDVFFTSVLNGSSTSDPRIRYDRLTGRWFLIIINVSTPNRILLAVSDAASNGTITAGTVFTFYFINIATTPPTISSTCFADYPTLGLDANALYIGTNDFCGAQQTFNSTDGYVIRKSSILSGGSMVVTVFRGLAPTASSAGPYTPQGVDNFDPAATEGYFIGVDNLNYGLLQMRRVSTPGGTPTISANIPITVASTSAPIAVPHLGMTGGGTYKGKVDALDDRLFAAHIRNGRLWTAHNIGVRNAGVASSAPNRDATRWYEFSVPTGSGTPTNLQTGTLYASSVTDTTDQLHYFIPSVMVSGQGHAALVFTTSGTAAYLNSTTVGRLSGDAGGTLQTPVNYSASSTAYNPSSDKGTSAPRRWGDYSYVSLDPLDDMTMWGVDMFCDAMNSYGVRIAKLVPPGPATPSSVPDITAGQGSVAVTLTGVSSGGTGFYDPGSNLPGGVPAFHHLAATITNGGASGTPPSVISATYVNPTTVNLVLNASAATANVGSEKYTITVVNPDSQSASAAVIRVVGGTPVATIAAGPSQNEGNSGTSTFDFTVNLTSAATSAVTINYATSDGTATTADSDYVAATSFITIPVGQSSGTIPVTVRGDGKYEPNETFTVTLTGATNATLGGTVASTGTIVNDDPQPTINIAAAVGNPEGNSGTTPFVFAVTLSNPSSSSVSAHYQTADGTATVADADYAAASGTVTIPAGQTSGSVTVNVNGDTKYEGNETFTVTLSSPSGGTLGGTPTGTGTIRNDDTAPVVSIVTSLQKTEGNSGTKPFGFVVSLSAASGLPVSVNYQTADGSATTADNDYQAASGTLNLAAGHTSDSVVVTVNGDTRYEGNETFAVTLSSPSGATLGNAAATGTIQNDDSPPVVSVSSVSLSEGNSGTTTFQFVVSLTQASGLAASADYATSDGTATLADNDYQPLSGTLNFTPGMVSQNLDVLVNGDAKAESDETFTLTLSNLSGLTAGTLAGTGTILNDDAVPVASIDSVTAAEGNSGTSSFVFHVHLSNPSDQPASVHYATSDGSATAADNDYLPASGTLNLPAGTLVGQIPVSVVGDSCGEPNETFNVTLTAPSGASLGTAVGVGTIQNDDNATPPTVTVVVPNGGEVEEVGNSVDIQWTASDDGSVKDVDVLLSRDGGSSYPEVLASGIPNTGSFNWTVTAPSAPTASAFVKVKAHDNSCNVGEDVSDAAFQISAPLVAVPSAAPITEFAMSAVRPNPTSGIAQVNFQLPRASAVRLSVLDVQGREVSVLVDRSMASGRYQATWNGQTGHGPAPTGVYFMRLVAGGRQFHRRLVLAR